MRLFVAIEIDSAVQDAIERTRQRIRKECRLERGAVKWVEPDNTHLTLVFLGEVDGRKAGEICSIAETAIQGHLPFELEIKGVGTFGRPARVVWAGISPSEQLKRLQSDLRENYRRAGWPSEDREFAGHLTLCRVKNSAAGHLLAEKVESMPAEVFGTSPVDSVCVFESQLGGGSPVYHRVSRIELK